MEDLELERLMAALRKRLHKGMSGKAVAKAVYGVLREQATLCGHNPDIETFFKGPADHHYAGKCWLANWEAGPYQWGISASFLIMDLTGRLCEPYYSFDVCLYDNE